MAGGAEVFEILPDEMIAIPAPSDLLAPCGEELNRRTRQERRIEGFATLL